MAQYLVALHHPEGYDPFAVEDEVSHDEINLLNAEMAAAGIRVFAGGLRPASSAASLQLNLSGEVVLQGGPYLKTAEHVGGFWVLEAACMDEALAWGRRAALACRAPVEVRPFFEME